jgi:hypothetical protein
MIKHLILAALNHFEYAEDKGVKVKVKGKVHPITGHKGPEGE